MRHNDSTTLGPTNKVAYEAPELITYGAVEDITLGTGIRSSDGVHGPSGPF